VPNTPTLVLGYHNVLPTAAFPGDAPGLPSFREQLRTFARRCAVVPFGRTYVRGQSRRPTVALTFDDGYRDNATLVAGLLADLGLPATFFLVTGFLDGTDYPWWEVVAAVCAHPGVERVTVGGHEFELGSADARAEARRTIERECNGAAIARRDELLAELLDGAGEAGADAVGAARERSPMMGWADAKALVEAGFTVGSHTERHTILAREDASVVAPQLTGSKRRLEAALGIDVTTFAYPRGAVTDFHDGSVRQVRDAGYRNAVTTIPGLNVAGTAPLRLRRLVLEPTMAPAALLRNVATQLGGSAARALFNFSPPARRASRSPRPSG
jgi:peptidoglycan/xylan/chitin deacetylase (PgdA/CDA1 family)